MKTIFKLAIALLAVFSFAACSDVPMPYEEPGTGNTSEDTYLDETFETSFGKFTNVTVKGNAWAIDYKTAKATGYDNSSKETTASEAYLVSSPVDLSKSAAAYLQFEYILRYVRAGQTENKVLITDNYTGDPTTTTWTDITGTLTEGSDWTTFATYKKNIPSEFLGKSNVVIALMYSCTTTSSTIEIKNLIMKDGTVEESGTTTPETPATGEKGQSKENPYTVQEAVDLITSGKAPSTEVYVKGIISNIDYYNTKYKSLSYYISDDGKSKALQIYSGKGLNGADFTSKEDLKVGQTVVIKGIIKSFTDKNGNKTEQYDKLKRVNAEIHRLGEPYMKYRNVSTVFVGFDGTEWLKNVNQKSVRGFNGGAFSGVSAVGDQPLVVGHMVKRDGSRGEALFICLADDPYDEDTKTQTIVFRTNGKKVKAIGNKGNVKLKWNKKGFYTMKMKSNDGVLIETIE